MRPLRWRRYQGSLPVKPSVDRRDGHLRCVCVASVARTRTGAPGQADRGGQAALAGLSQQRRDAIYPHRRLCWRWPKRGSVVARTGPWPVGRVAKRCGCQSVDVLRGQTRGARGLDRAPSSLSSQPRALRQAHRCTRTDKRYRQIKKRQDTGARRATRRGGAGGSQPAAPVGRRCQTPHPRRGSPAPPNGANGRGGTPRGMVAGGSHRPADPPPAHLRRTRRRGSRASQPKQA